MFQDEAREALMKSTAVDGERFFVKTRFGKWRNTLCISHFSNRRIGGKAPPSVLGDLFRGSPDLVGSTSRNTAGAGTVSVPACLAIISVSTAMLRVYQKTPNAPGQRVFLRCAASFFLEIRQYSCEKMSCSTQKSLTAGHIMSFQIHPTARWSR